jgi:hypothetical protein
MAGDPVSFDFVAALQSVKGGMGATSLAAWGVWAGPQAKQFQEPLTIWASGVCLAAMVLGISLLTIAVGRTIFARAA